MPLAVEISLINTIEGKALAFEDLNSDEGPDWSVRPPDLLAPFQYCRCSCTGPSSGYQIALKYAGLICRIDVTAWGIAFQKSTPSQNDLELIQIKESAPYRLEIILI